VRGVPDEFWGAANRLRLTNEAPARVFASGFQATPEWAAQPTWITVCSNPSPHLLKSQRMEPEPRWIHHINSLDEWLRHSSGLDIACNQWGSPCSLNSADQPAQLAQVRCNERLYIDSARWFRWRQSYNLRSRAFKVELQPINGFEVNSNSL